MNRRSARAELLAAQVKNKHVEFIAADMNHELARKNARDQNQLEPTDFRGSAHLALALDP